MEIVKTTRMTLTINGREYTIDVAPNLTLQQMLKDKFALTGTKRGCGRGECGSCTVIMDGKPVNACLTLALECDGSVLETIEGEAKGDELSELQEAFIEHGAIQYGFCTPGMVMSARALLDRNPSPNHEEVVEAIAGNLCRCTGYEAIIEAIEAVAKKRKG
jgi:carbon-monoxide dehydrogenase small subunit